MKKYILLFISLVLIIFTTGFSTPTLNDIERNASKKMSDQQLELFEKFKENGGEISILTKKEEKKVKNAIVDKKKLKNFYNQQFKGYEEISLPSKNASFKISDDNGTNYLLYQAYEKNNSYIMTTSVYDGEKDILTSFTAEKKTINNGTKKVSNTETLIQYTASDSDSNGNISTQDWEWNGKTFACGMTGVFACIQYCGVWTLVNPYVGAGCDIVCNAAMVVACM